MARLTAGFGPRHSRVLPGPVDRARLWPMKLRLDLLEHLTDEDILEEVLANNHRYKPEPLFSKTGVGSLSSASTEERAREVEHSMELTRKLEERARKAGSGSAAP